MKKLLATVLILVVIAGTAPAQGKFSFGVGAEVALPITSGFSDAQTFGFGGSARGYYPLNDMVTFTGTAGLMIFPGKDRTIGGIGLTGNTWTMIPVVVGGRYYFMPASSSMRFYGAFEMGLIFSSYKVSATVPSGFNPQTGQITYSTVTSSASGSDFTYQPQIGFEAKQWDIAVRYLGVSGAASIAARIGYIFN